MNKKELLEECKRRYPIGTEIECVGDFKHNAIATVDPWFNDYGFIRVRPDGKGGTCYYNGEWAKIISKPQSKQEQLETEYERVEKEQKARAEKIAKIKADQEKKLHLEVIEGVLWIMYGTEAFGYIDGGGVCVILTEHLYQKNWEQWNANGMPVSHDVVDCNGNHYKIDGFELINTDITYGSIYDFKYCVPSKECRDRNIQRYSNGTVKIF